MRLDRILKERNISAYRLSKKSDVPYMTINDLVNNKTSFAKCNAETAYKIAKALDMSIEELIGPYMKKRTSFELFKSNVCHKLKELGDIDFLADLLESDEIKDYFDLEWYPECLYLLGMLDYISRVNNVPICMEYNNLRTMKLSSIAYPSSVIAMDAASKSDAAKKEAWKNCIPEFKRFNIVENEVRNVV